jgi:hypothetical protein
VEECENVLFSAPFSLYDVPVEVADNYRLLINYLYTSKPPFASSWSKEGFDLLPSEIIDRGTRTAFESDGCKTATTRAHERMKRILEEKEPRQVPAEKKKALIDIVRTRAKKYGMEKLPIEDYAGVGPS